MQPNLNPREVSSLFSVPLRAFLYHVPPVALRPSLRLPAMPSEDDMLSASEVSGPSDWHHCRDISWFGERIRRHDFWHRSNPIRGLTRCVASLRLHQSKALLTQLASVTF